MPRLLHASVLATLSSLLPLSSFAAAQSASYTLYGYGCNGAGVNWCISQNAQNPSLFLASLPNEYAYAVTNTSGVPMQIVGFDAFTVTNTGAVQTVNSALYHDNSGPGALSHTVPSATAIATGRMTVTNVTGWFTTIVSPPLVVAPGECFWIGLDAYSFIAPPQHANRTPGPIPAQWRRPGLAWAATGLVYDPILRVHCAGGQVPVATLTNTGNPLLGTSMQIDLSGGQPFLPAFFFWGFTDTNWVGLPIPVDLAIFGAPGCNVWTSSETPNFLLLDPNGRATQTIAVPATATLSGFTFFNQVAMTEPAANPMGLKVSNAGRGVLGL